MSRYVNLFSISKNLPFKLVVITLQCILEEGDKVNKPMFSYFNTQIYEV